MKSQVTTPTTIFQFWKDNRLDQKFTLTADELVDKFKTWVASKEVAWINYYSTDRAICAFITDKEELKGLSSVHDSNEFQVMYELLRPIYIDAHKTEV